MLPSINILFHFFSLHLRNEYLYEFAISAERSERPRSWNQILYTSRQTFKRRLKTYLLTSSE